MFKLLRRFFCNEKGNQSECNHENQNLLEIYYKIRVNKYYGLQGFKWEYGKARKVPLRDGGLISNDWEVVGFNPNKQPLSIWDFLLIKPVRSIEITKEEYELNATPKIRRL